MKVTFELPSVIEDKLLSGDYERIGGVIVESKTKKIVCWLKEKVGVNNNSLSSCCLPSVLGGLNLVTSMVNIGITAYYGEQVKEGMSKLNNSIDNISTVINKEFSLVKEKLINVERGIDKINDHILNERLAKVWAAYRKIESVKYINNINEEKSVFKSVLNDLLLLIPIVSNELMNLVDDFSVLESKKISRVFLFDMDLLNKIKRCTQVYVIIFDLVVKCASFGFCVSYAIDLCNYFNFNLIKDKINTACELFIKNTSNLAFIASDKKTYSFFSEYDIEGMLYENEKLKLLWECNVFYFKDLIDNVIKVFNDTRIKSIDSHVNSFPFSTFGGKGRLSMDVTFNFFESFINISKEIKNKNKSTSDEKINIDNLIYYRQAIYQIMAFIPNDRMIGKEYLSEFERLPLNTLYKEINCLDSVHLYNVCEMLSCKVDDYLLDRAYLNQCFNNDIMVINELLDIGLSQEKELIYCNDKKMNIEEYHELFKVTHQESNSLAYFYNDDIVILSGKDI